MDDVSVFQIMLAKAEFLYMFYQSAHWQSKGDTYYADHLLFQRLYENLREEIDIIGEKAVGIIGETEVNLFSRLVLINEEIGQNLNSISNESFEVQALKLEQEFIKTLEAIDAMGGLSIGVKNMVEDLADKHEGHIYLLKQRAR